MLKDLPDDWRPMQDPLTRMLRGITDNKIGIDHINWWPTRVHRGVYLAHINFDHELFGVLSERWPEIKLANSYHWADRDTFCSFGVIDHWSQLPLKLLDKDPRNLLVFLARHAKAEQPERYGWRWHKWGPYLGIFREQAAAYEYLYDTPDVTEVWSYSVVELCADKKVSDAE